MNCPFCGNTINDGYTVCGNCGAYEKKMLAGGGIMAFGAAILWGIPWFMVFDHLSTKHPNDPMAIVALAVSIVPIILVVKFGRTKQWFRDRYQ